MGTVLFYRDVPLVHNGVENVGRFLPLALENERLRVFRYPCTSARDLRLRQLAMLARSLHSSVPELLHLNWTPSKLDWVLLRALRVTRCPTTVFVHGDLGAEMAWNQNLSAPARKAFARWRAFQRRASRVIVASDFMKRSLSSSYGLREESIAVIPNGISLHQYRPVEPVQPRQAGLLLYVGSLWRMKGVDILLRAMARMSSAFPSLRLKIVGGGGERPVLMRLVREAGLESRITFCGVLEQNQLLSLYREAMALVLPSRSEAFGIVLLEAMASGLPVVAADTGGIPEVVVSRENGLLFETESVERLEEQLEAIITQPDLRQRLSERGLHTVKNYDWPLIAKRYKALFDRVASSDA